MSNKLDLKKLKKDHPKLVEAIRAEAASDAAKEAEKAPPMDLGTLKEKHPKLVEAIRVENDAANEVEEVAFDIKWLKGLKHRSSEAEVVEKDGRKVKKFVPKERAMTAEDVLAWRDCGDHVVIGTSDGQKVSVKKDK